MKIVLNTKKNKVQEFVDPLTAAAGVLGIAGIIIAIISKFFGQDTANATKKATKEAEASSKALVDAVATAEAEASGEPVPPPASAAKKQPSPTVIKARQAHQKLLSVIQKFEKEHKDVQKVQDLPKKPSEMLAEAFQQFEHEIEALIPAGSRSKKVDTILKSGKARLDKCIATFNSLDQIALMFNQKIPDGLWGSVISKTELGNKLKDPASWKQFVNALTEKITKVETAEAPGSVPAPAPTEEAPAES